MTEVHVDDRGGVRVVRLNRPRALNAVDRVLRLAFVAAMRAADADRTVAAVVVTGTGERAFCAGQDIDEAAGIAGDAAVEDWLTGMRDLYQSVRDVGKPTVVACNGLAAGAGMQIALAADVRVGFPEMRFGQPEVKAGLASIVGTWFLAQYVGAGVNAELSLSGELISGERAHALGLLTRLVPRAEVLETALAEARRLAAMPPTAYRLTKQRLREMTQPGFDAAYRAGVAAQRRAYAAGEPQRAMAAFLARRAGAR
ncbi:MAG: enoyl-CoA hydratase/isomerase family protein [Alphaproteobacteria bacterium]|nr:enoyl-CoA hydratase/isomerase family protein [Alphaproteobacteria bacterium]